MSRNELVEAYLEGKISRRGFIRGMAATGASLTMAAAAADQLRVSAQVPGDPYGPYETPTVIASPTQVPPSPTAAPTQVPPAPTKAPKTPTPKATAAPTNGGGGTGTTTLPETGTGQNTKSGIMGPLSLAASAAAAAIAFRVRQFRKPAESDSE